MIVSAKSPTTGSSAASPQPPGWERSRAHEIVARLLEAPQPGRIRTGLRVLRQLAGAEAALVMEEGEGGRFGIAAVAGELPEGSGGFVERAAAQVCGEAKARQDRMRVGGRSLILVTVPVKGTRPSCVALLFSHSEKFQAGLAAAVLQWFALLCYAGEREDRHGRETRAAQRLAGVVEALGHAAGCDDLEETHQEVVERFRALAGCQRVALASAQAGRIRLRAISGRSGPNPNRTELAGILTATLAQSIRGDRELSGAGRGGAPRGDDEARTSASGETLLERLDPGYFWGAPLRHEEVVRGGWIFLWETVPDDLEERLSLLRAAGPLVGGHLELWRRGQPGKIEGAVRRLWRRARVLQKRMVMAAAVVVAGILLAPFPLPVGAGCSLEPWELRTVAAPFDGVLRATRVEPGQWVEAGEVLAVLDDREIRWQLSDAFAKRLRASKQADAALSEGRVAEAQIAQLESRSFEETVQLLRYRQANLEIKAPVAGRVLRGDLRRREGAIVRMGESLFEVAPLDRMRVLIEVDEADVALVREGAPASVRFAAAGNRRWEVGVDRIAPRSEYRNGANVFLCRAEIDNSEAGLRPGSRGQARIEGPRRPLIWRGLRGPWMALARYLP